MPHKIVFLDAFTTNPGDLDFKELEGLGNFSAFDRTDADDMLHRAEEAEIVIVNKFPVNEKTLAFMPKLKYVCVAATGFNNLDVALLKSKNIQASNVRNYSTDSVAQHVFASILAWYNRIESYNHSVKQGDWSSCKDFCYYTSTIQPLNGKILGIAGYGAIGRKVAQLGVAFGMKIKVFLRSRIEHDHEVTQVDKNELLETSDILSLHMPLTDQTLHWMNKASFQKMKSNSLLINTARGPLVHADDLKMALAEKKIAGAILDVLDEEPPKHPHPVILEPNCWVTPHIAWAGLEARQKLIEGIIENIKAFQKGEWINRIYG